VEDENVDLENLTVFPSLPPFGSSSSFAVKRKFTLFFSPSRIQPVQELNVRAYMKAGINRLNSNHHGVHSLAQLSGAENRRTLGEPAL
jgi:hypothetical protein